MTCANTPSEVRSREQCGGGSHGGGDGLSGVAAHCRGVMAGAAVTLVALAWALSVAVVAAAKRWRRPWWRRLWLVVGVAFQPVMAWWRRCRVSGGHARDAAAANQSNGGHARAAATHRQRQRSGGGHARAAATHRQRQRSGGGHARAAATQGRRRQRGTAAVAAGHPSEAACRTVDRHMGGGHAPAGVTARHRACSSRAPVEGGVPDGGPERRHSHGALPMRRAGGQADTAARVTGLGPRPPSPAGSAACPLGLLTDTTWR
ncbi:hypothetical protein A8924_0314 [Saccharopolyspora erythraea NRRL 2338]|nr:hypothetical protein A8924_0314 [Saccharopolyspora erythraea NRRL 2338]